MFALELIAKLAEYTLGDLGRRIISRGADPKRRFAADLLSSYHSLKNYRETCNQLIVVVQEMALEPREVPHSYEVHKIQEISDRMAESVETIVARISSEWVREAYDTILYPQAKSKKSSRKSEIIEIYDPKLGALLKHATTHDIWIAGIARQLGRIKADWYSQQLIFINPDTLDVSDALATYDTAVDAVRWGKRVPWEKSKYIRVLHLDSKDDLDSLVRMLRENKVLVSSLIEGMASFMKTNFVLEDL